MRQHLRKLKLWVVGLLVLPALSGCAYFEKVLYGAPDYDVVIRNGVLFDGSGEPGTPGDIAFNGDKIAAIGDLGRTRGKRTINARGQAIAPGFINMLSWGADGLIEDGRGLSDLRQGVTLEVFGEGVSYGPWSEATKRGREERQSLIKYDIEWSTLGEFLEYLEARGVSPNVASFVGATTLRAETVGLDNRVASDDEIARMQAMAREAMEEGAMGLGSSLIYVPANFASTDELIALASVAAEYDGMYISHLRSEAEGLMEGLEELITIAETADLRAEVYHVKASGQRNWEKMDQVIARINEARDRGLSITADMYAYPASSTGLDAAMPVWVQEGGIEKWVVRLQDPRLRARVAKQMANPSDEFVSGIVNAGGPEGVLLLGFRNPDLRHYIGRTLADVAAERGVTAEEAAMDLVIEDNSRVQVAYFSMSEDNLAKKIRQPWVSFGSDGGTFAPEGVFLERSTHPRAYGNFARVFAKYVRDDNILTIEEAVRRLTSLPAENLKLRQRGALRVGYFADVVVFDPETIQDQASFSDPHQLATGVNHVFVNGTHTIRNEKHTGELAGRVVRGPGWTGWSREE